MRSSSSSKIKGTYIHMEFYRVMIDLSTCIHVDAPPLSLCVSLYHTRLAHILHCVILFIYYVHTVTTLKIGYCFYAYTYVYVCSAASTPRIRCFVADKSVPTITCQTHRLFLHTHNEQLLFIAAAAAAARMIKAFHKCARRSYIINQTTHMRSTHMQ